MQDAAVLKELYRFLQGDNELLYLTTLTRPYATGFTPQQTAEVIQKYKDRDIYFLVNVFRSAVIETGRIGAYTGIENVEQVQFIFQDLDILRDAETMTQEEALAKCEELYRTKILPKLSANGIPRPSLVVFSGRGLHLYWKISCSTNFEKWRAVQTALINLLRNEGSDPHITNPNRAMRLPGSCNTKRRKITTVIEFNPDEIYRLDSFTHLLSETEKNRESDKHTEVTVKELTIGLNVHLDTQTVKQIVDTIKPFYVPGYRHYIMLYLVGLLIKERISTQSIKAVFDLLTDITNDEEKKDRYRQTVASQLNSHKPLSSIAGYSKLREVIKEQLMQHLPEAKARETADQVVKEITGLIKSVREKEFIMQKSADGSVSVVIRPGEGMTLKVVKKVNNRWHTEKIPLFFGEIWLLAVTNSQNDPEDSILTVEIIHYDPNVKVPRRINIKMSELPQTIQKLTGSLYHEAISAYLITEAIQFKARVDAARLLEEVDNLTNGRPS